MVMSFDEFRILAQFEYEQALDYLSKVLPFEVWGDGSWNKKTRPYHRMAKQYATLRVWFPSKHCYNPEFSDCISCEGLEFDLFNLYEFQIHHGSPELKEVALSQRWEWSWRTIYNEIIKNTFLMRIKCHTKFHNTYVQILARHAEKSEVPYELY